MKKFAVSITLLSLSLSVFAQSNRALIDEISNKAQQVSQLIRSAGPGMDQQSLLRINKQLETQLETIVGANIPAPIPQPIPQPQPIPTPIPTRDSGIRVIGATFGSNVVNVRGNATQSVATYCNGLDFCRYFTNTYNLGDPAPGRSKTFDVTYSCDGVQYRASINQVASGITSVELVCNGSRPRYNSRIQVIAATFGGNLNVLNKNNVIQNVRSFCDGYEDCNMIIDRSFGDPAPGMAKDLSVTYSCDGALRSSYTPVVAVGNVIKLDCQGR